MGGPRHPCHPAPVLRVVRNLSGYFAPCQLEVALGFLQRSLSASCWAFERLRSDAVGALCVRRLVEAVRLLALIPALGDELRQLLAIERDMATADRRGARQAGPGAARALVPGGTPGS